MFENVVQTLCKIPLVALFVIYCIWIGTLSYECIRRIVLRIASDVFSTFHAVHKWIFPKQMSIKSI